MSTTVRLTLWIESGNSSMQDGNHTSELCNILDYIKHNIVMDVFTDGTERSIHDVCGNKIGVWSIDVKEED